MFRHLLGIFKSGPEESPALQEILQSCNCHINYSIYWHPLLQGEPNPPQEKISNVGCGPRRKKVTKRSRAHLYVSSCNSLGHRHILTRGHLWIHLPLMWMAPKTWRRPSLSISYRGSLGCPFCYLKDTVMHLKSGEKNPSLYSYELCYIKIKVTLLTSVHPATAPRHSGFHTQY